MSENAKAMVLASLVGDALCLAPHWYYDPAELAARFAPVTGYRDPLPGGYHAGKKAGDQTHYGDQTLVLLASLAARGGFDPDDFAARWRELFRDYAGYVDGATRMTLRVIEFGDWPGSGGSNSNDLAGAARVAPLVFALADEAALEAAARAQTRLTHNHAQVMDAAAFFARAARNVLAGDEPAAALGRAAGADYPSAPVGAWLAAGLDSAGTDTVAALGVFGRSCHIDEAMPGVIHLLARHGHDLAGCLRENVLAGGDSAARGLLCGMVLGAAHGLPAIPPDWLAGLSARTAVEDALASLSG